MHANCFIPDDFIAYLTDYTGSPETVDEILSACRRPLRKSIRVNTLRIRVGEFKKIAMSKGWALTPIPWCEDGFWINTNDATNATEQLGNSAEHLAGLFYIQEASSMLPPVALLHGRATDGHKIENQLVLDMAAAPGSKSSQLASLMENSGLLVTNEFSSSRVKVLSANMIRCGISNNAISHYNGDVFGHWLPNTFDFVLLDAPCSGEGSLRKDPDAMKNWSLQHVSDTTELQYQLLQSAFNALKPGGCLVYSTCTLNHFENQQVCHRLLKAFDTEVSVESLASLFDGAARSITEEGFLHVWPQTYDSEGFFIAKFLKAESPLATQIINKKKTKFPFLKCETKWQQDFNQTIAKQFGMTLPDPFECFQKDNEIWFFPEQYHQVKDRFKFQRCGVKIAELHRNGYRLTHDFASIFGHLAKSNSIELNESQVLSLYSGKDIFVEDKSILPAGNTQQVLRFQGTGLSIAKIVNGKIKNKLPRALINSQLCVTA